MTRLARRNKTRAIKAAKKRLRQRYRPSPLLKLWRQFDAEAFERAIAAAANLASFTAAIYQSLGVPKQTFAGGGPGSLLVPNKDTPRSRP